VKTTPIRKILTSVLVLIVGFWGFYKFMTYDRKYTWSKEFEEEVRTVAKNNGLNIVKTDRINVDDIKLPTERATKICIQKLLSKVNVMTYADEFGQSILLTTDDTTELLICKGWCLGDHLIGLEIEHKNIDKSTFTNLKDSFQNQFDNYKIIWTQLPAERNVPF